MFLQRHASLRLSTGSSLDLALTTTFVGTFVIILRVNGSRILNCSSVFRGLSTFLVEMKDIQVMLREATDDSLVSSENS